MANQSRPELPILDRLTRSLQGSLRAHWEFIDAPCVEPLAMRRMAILRAASTESCERTSRLHVRIASIAKFDWIVCTRML